jgi:hypothetical protein
MRRVLMVAVLAMVAIAQLGSSATASPPGAPESLRAEDRFLEVGPIVANFVQADFATYYSIEVTPVGAASDVKVVWRLEPPKADPKCNAFTQSASDRFAAVWKHNATDGCTHAHQEGPRGHAGRVMVTVGDGVMECRATYSGTVSGTGDDATCFNAALTAATLRIQSAVLYERDAIRELRAGRSARERIGLAVDNLTGALTLCAKGGAPSSVRPLIDQAIELDEAALRLPSSKGIVKLMDAIQLKEKAVKLLKAATS